MRRCRRTSRTVNQGREYSQVPREHLIKHSLNSCLGLHNVNMPPLPHTVTSSREYLPFTHETLVRYTVQPATFGFAVSDPAIFDFAISGPAISDPANPALRYSTLRYPALQYPALRYPALRYPTLRYPALRYPA
ncbi:hypothetical protein J6590_023425 [Homalodisca vitripennis]|nr:hypothetical protein J6590_023425 [Homalodisca vitripennis]